MSTSYESDRAANRPRHQTNISCASSKSSEIPTENLAPYAHWAKLVERIQACQADGMEELYRFFKTGVCRYLRRSGSRDLEDRLHNVFVVTVQAIQEGDLREPERLMGFVRTVTQRQGWAHIRELVSKRTEEISCESEWEINAGGPSPEQAAIFRQREELAKRILDELSDRDREVLIRFYLKEQPCEQICLEMNLTETQFRLLKSRAKARFGILGKKRLRPRLIAPFT